MLAKKAMLNTAQMVVDQIARILVAFILTPILVGHLGATVFGIWQILQKTSFQLAPMDGCTPEVLKWTIASQQNNDDAAKKQRAVGSAVVSFFIFVPILVTVYAVMIAVLPQYLNLGATQVWETRAALALLGINTLLFVVAGLFEATLRGMNLSYKLTGLQAVVLVAGGGMSALAAIQGYGLLGLASAQIVSTVLFIIFYSVVAKRHIVWLGIRKPSVGEIRESLLRSKWYTIWALISAWLLAGDVIVLGAFSESHTVSKYILTMYVTQMMTVAILTAIGSALPGLAGIIGKGEYQRAALLRNESLLYSWWLCLTICTAVIVFNQSFVSLWVGGQQYAGDNVNALIAACVMQLVFIRHDADMLNMALDVRKKVVIGFVSALITLLLMLVLIPLYELSGLCISLLLGRAMLSIAYPRIINKFLKSKIEKQFPIRRLITTILCLLFGWTISNYIFVGSWWALIAGGSLFTGAMFLLLYSLGMNSTEKQITKNRFNKLKSLRSR